MSKLLGIINAMAMPRTLAEDPLQKFMFRVTIPGLDSKIGFQKVGGLSREVEVVEYLEGTFPLAHKLSGREKVGEIVLERGMFEDAGLEGYYKKILTDPTIRSTVTIEFLDRQGAVRRKYTLKEAWASKWEGSDADATSSDVAIEKVTLQYEGYAD
jgi:phage tail-like protein